MIIDATGRKRYETTIFERRKAKARRDANRAAGRCVNDNAAGTHGPATHGCRCLRCHEKHK